MAGMFVECSGLSSNDFLGHAVHATIFGFQVGCRFVCSRTEAAARLQ